MSCSCRSSIDRVDSHAHVPVRANYVNLYKRPESDAEFMRSLAARERRGGTIRDDNIQNTARGSTPAFIDGYSCRQTYLKSYTFSRKESKKERARRCLVRAKDRTTSSFVFLCKKTIVGGKRRSMKKKNCFIVVGELRRTYRAMVGAVFRRVVSCGTAVYTGDQHFG